jgi:hypothetical protein
MSREPKRRDRPKWDGMVALGCHGACGEGINGRDRSAGRKKTLRERQSTSSGEEVRVERSAPFVKVSGEERERGRTRVGYGVCCHGVERVGGMARRRSRVAWSVRCARSRSWNVGNAAFWSFWWRRQWREGGSGYVDVFLLVEVRASARGD